MLEWWGKTYIVEKVVGTGQLLQGLKHHTKDNTEEHARRSQELMPLLLLVQLGFLLLTDLVHFFHNSGMVLRNAIEFGQIGSASVDIPVAEIKSRALGEEQHTTTQTKGKEEGQAQGDTPLGSVFQALGSQVDAVGKEDTQGDEELVATDNRTTDVTGGRFTYDKVSTIHVKRMKTDVETYPDTSERQGSSHRRQDQ